MPFFEFAFERLRAKLAFLLAVMASSSAAVSSDPVDTTWVTNNAVRTIARTSSTIYLGGDFTYVGPVTGSGTTIDAVTAAPNIVFPRINGTVNASVSDGNGGWYVGGEFNKVGNVTRNFVAHVLADGTVNPAFDPNPSQRVTCLAVSGSTVYIGGDFTTIAGQPRNYLAAFDRATGALTSWNPSPQYQIYCMTLSGSTLYVSGLFETIGGQSRYRLAALDAVTGLATPFSADVSEYNTVYALVVSGSTLYIGGAFNSIGGQPRNSLAAVDAATGEPTPWNPNSNATVFALAVSGSTVYAGGQFTSIGSQPRNHIAAIDATSGIVTSWDPAPNHWVRSLTASGSTLYVGGEFTFIAGQARPRLAAFDTGTGALSAWDPGAGHKVKSLAVEGTSIFAGGEFDSVGGVARQGLAALDVNTGAATAWDPQATLSSNSNPTINALTTTGSLVYVGGYFTNMGGEARNNLAAIDADTAAATSWNPNANSHVSALATSGTVVYVGGFFSTVGGEARSRIAAIDVDTGLPTEWNPSANNEVNALVTSGSVVYAGGRFSTIGGSSKPRLAALDSVTGNALPWNGGISNFSDSSANSIVLSGQSLYAGGNFFIFGGDMNFIAKDTMTGANLPFDPDPTGEIKAMALSGSTLYFGGLFRGIGGQTRNRLAAVDLLTGAATDWDPGIIDGEYGSSVQAIATSGSSVYVGGHFEFMNGNSQPYFAEFTDDVTSPVSTAIITDATQAGGSITGGYSATDEPGGSRIFSVTLYVKPPGGNWTNAGLVNGSTFSYTPTSGEGEYRFATVATDGSGNAETAPAAADPGDVSILWNDVPNSTFTHSVTSGGTFTFPMTSDLDTSITLTGVTAPGLLTVSRVDGDVAAPGLPASGFIDQAWSIHGDNTLGFGSADIVFQYDETALGGLNETQIDRAWRDDEGTTTELPITLDIDNNTATVTGVTDFSTWYLGNETLVPVTLSGFSLE